LRPSKWSSLGIGLLLGGPLDDSSCHSRSYLSLSTLHLLISLPFGIFECIDPRINSYLISLGFTKSDADSNLYYKVEDGCPLILVLYVDDLFLIGDEKLIVGCKRELTSEFEMKDLGVMHYFLGLEVWQRLDKIFLSQGKYTIEILQRFGMMDYKSMATLMVTNLKLLYDSSSDLVDPTKYS
jgi:hypothetical protein